MATTLPALSHTYIETWFERDRAYIGLFETYTGKLIMEWWDDALLEVVACGFLDPRDYHKSAYEYAVQILLSNSNSS